MNADPKTITWQSMPWRSAQPNRQMRLLSVGALLLAAAAALFGAAQPSRAQDVSPEMQSAPSFVDDFKSFDRSRWYVSDGWSNGNHQNCTWSKSLVKLSDGMLTLGFEKRKLKDREFACAEIQTKQRFGYGTYEARMKTDTGSGLNAAFFSYIGPADKQPWYEIDFEVLTKDTSKVQVNSLHQRQGQEREAGRGRRRRRQGLQRLCLRLGKGPAALVRQRQAGPGSDQSRRNCRPIRRRYSSASGAATS